jgi:hypothetical protein
MAMYRKDRGLSFLMLRDITTMARSAKLSEAARRESVREYGGNEVTKSSQGCC